MAIFSKLRGKGAQPAKGKNVDLTNGSKAQPVKPRWQSTWTSTEVEPDEVQELIHACTAEMKLRGEDLVYLGSGPATDFFQPRRWIRHFYYCPSDWTETLARHAHSSQTSSSRMLEARINTAAKRCSKRSD